MNINETSSLVDIYSEFDKVLEEDSSSCEEEPVSCEDILSSDDQLSIYESIYGMFDEYMENHLMNMKLMSFDESVMSYIMENIEMLIEQTLNNVDIEVYKPILDDIYKHARKDYFTNFIPPRSYPTTFIRRKPNIESMTQIIEHLRNKPQPDQRTDAWYKFRYNLLTASSIWKAFGSQSMQNQLIFEKCTPLNVGKYQSVNTESAMHHGQKYEELSVMYYERMYKTKIEDFGCIQHDDYYYIGASPDGINIDLTSDRYGRMLEIKNTVSREITGIPKEEYWVQMQLQMETCGLNECDFLETQFNEYESQEEFLQEEDKDKVKGLIVYFMENGKPMYKYMPLDITNTDDMFVWENKIIDENSQHTWVKTIYWRLDKVSCILVLRNKKWFQCARKYIEDLWKIVEVERVSGYEHRGPKKSNRKRASSFVDITTEESGCLLDSSLFTSQMHIPTNVVVCKLGSDGEAIPTSCIGNANPV